MSEKVKVDIFNSENGRSAPIWLYYTYAIGHIPIIGDEVRIDDQAYKVRYRIFIFDEEIPRVALDVEAIK